MAAPCYREHTATIGSELLNRVINAFLTKVNDNKALQYLLVNVY
jgi:hypothetical protein